MRPDPLELQFEDGSFAKFSHADQGAVLIETRGPLAPTTTAMEVPLESVDALRKWLGKHDAARRAEGAKAA